MKTNNAIDLGWIAIFRKIREHWVWDDPARLKAWISILIEVNHEKAKVAIGNTIIDCNRGQSLYSLRTWAKQFGDDWSVMKVRAFFKMLEDDGMIIRERISNTTRITVCHYDDYQKSKHCYNSVATLPEHSCNIATSINNNKNNKNNKNNDDNKNILLSEISKLDLSGKEEQYVKITMLFYETALFNLESQGISTVRLKKAKAKNWIAPIRLIIEQKEADKKQLYNLSKFLRVDPFWKKVILSTSKLREKLPQLLLAMKNYGSNQPHFTPENNQLFAYSKHDATQRL